MSRRNKKRNKKLAFNYYEKPFGMNLHKNTKANSDLAKGENTHSIPRKIKLLEKKRQKKLIPIFERAKKHLQ